MKVISKGSLLRASSAYAVLFCIVGGGALAQPSDQGGAQPQATSGGLEEVVVTSRRVSEKLLAAPIAVTAFSAQTLQERGVTDLRSVALFTPGLTVNAQGGGNSNANRTIQTIDIRAMNKAGLVTVFVDGVSTQGLIEGLDDLERVEILKGPQSALFGRSTFAGAINYVTKDPAKEFKGNVDVTYGSDQYTDDRLTLEGPLVEDKLSARLSGRYYSTQGQYANTALLGERLNDQSTKGANAKFLLTPTDDIRISALGKYSEDNDGPGAEGQFGQSDYNCNAGAAPAGKLNFICGTLPAYPASRLAEVTILTPAVQNRLFNNTNNVWYPLFKNQLGLNHGGDIMTDKLGVLNAEYTEPNTEITFSSLTGLEEEQQAVYEAYQLRASNLNTVNPNYTVAKAGLLNPYLGYDALVNALAQHWSQEFRASTDSSERLRGVLGVNYNYVLTQVSGVNLAPTGAQSTIPGNANITKTAGLFGSVAYDVLPDELTVNFEGRYQLDRPEVRNRILGGAADQTTPAFSSVNKNFLYRGIIQYHITPDIQAYISTSRAVNPGGFNSLNGYSAAQQSVINQVFKVGAVIRPEYLHNYEIGIKGSFFDKTLTASLAVYHADWSNQQVQQSVYVPSVTAAGVLTGATQLVQATSNIASTKLDGAELEGQWRATDNLTVSYAGSISGSDVSSFPCSLCTAVTGQPFVNGKEMPLVSKYILSIGPSYRAPLDIPAEMLSNTDWYANVLYTYRSGMYEWYDNLAKTMALNNVDVRVGLTNDQWTLETYVTNALNSKAPSGVETNSDYLSAGLSAKVVNVTMPILRRFGVRAKYNFGGPPETAAVDTATYVPPPVVAPAQPARSYMVFFDFNKSDLSSQAVQIVDTAAKNAGPAKVTQIEVTGHTDTVGSDAYNMRLSRRRAESVAAEMEKQGIPSSEIEIVAKGKKDLLVPTADGVKEPQNRRVQIVYEGAAAS